ncbi:MAG: DUF4388 domain-containing protein [Deltaproteobacteria bacterium]|nr:DUF4388 domain-containing protein [Deltaproteobacteria bacterium]
MSVRGRLKDMSLVDIIQVFSADRKSMTIHLSSDSGYGRVFMNDGKVVHASYREFSGAEAVYQLLAWKDGEFEVEQGVAPVEQTIADSTQFLMLEGLKRLDELKNQGRETRDHAGDMESIRLVNTLLELGILERVEEGEDAKQG